MIKEDVLRYYESLGMVGITKTIRSLYKGISEGRIEISEKDLTKILSNIRKEMNGHMKETKEEEKLLRNYIFGRLATLDEIEKRLR